MRHSENGDVIDLRSYMSHPGPRNVHLPRPVLAYPEVHALELQQLLLLQGICLLLRLTDIRLPHPVRLDMGSEEKGRLLCGANPLVAYRLLS